MSKVAARLNSNRYGEGHAQPSFKRLRRIGTIAKTVLALALLVISIAAQMGRIIPVLDPLNALSPLIIAAAVILCIFSIRYDRLVLAMAGLAALCSVERVAPVFLSAMQVPIPDSSGIVVLSLNAWKHQDHPKQTARAIAASGADIVLLQEAGPLLSQADTILKSAYPFRSNCPTGCDLAILSRLPVRKFRYRIRDSRGMLAGPRIVFGEIVGASDLGPITVASIHVDRGDSPIGNRQQIAKSLDELFALLGKEDLIIGGDFNMTPYSFAFAKMDQAMFPIRRVSFGDHSYPSQIAGLPTIPLFAIDHIYASPRWHAARVSVDHGFHSDHRPIAVRLLENRPDLSHE